ncbi:MAG: 8-amino-7-oxononanoate synthase [Gammaproteobacteria bacterium]|nr:8-amino-7-oxononanoate synthase [Gammaproteobacteria bacterium]
MPFDHLAARLKQRRQQHLYRQRRTTQGPQGAELVVDGRALLNFCSNDYLGLANHPEVVAAFKRGADDYGVGSGAAHLICGHSTAHHALEDELAEFTGRQRALLFSTGFMANLGIVTALLDKNDAVFEDRLNHASLLDAGLASGARFKRYAHGDVAALEKHLTDSDAENKLVLTDGVFSMDGDVAPLAKLATCCAHQNAWLMVDDAHGFGVLGPQGRGSVAAAGLDAQQVPVYMATLGKGAGVFGAFVAGSETLIEYLINEARSYVYTTAMPPALAAALRASLRLIHSEQWRRDKVMALAARFRAGAGQLGFQLLPSDSPIQALILGDEARAIAASEKLLAQGILVSAIRPPTVPKGTARLRITFSAEHSEQQVDQLLSALEKI